MLSPKEISLNQRITELAAQVVAAAPGSDDLPVKVVADLIGDPEIQAMQEYANVVSIKRLDFNDHGPVHMRTVCRNALKMLLILHQAGIKTSLETEQSGIFSDSVTAVAMAAFMHDLGMTVGRSEHELYSGIMAYGIIDRILRRHLSEPYELNRLVVVRSMAMEGILGHMGSRKIHSLEAGLILIADGCDMTKGRARIPLLVDNQPSAGDIHKYSANSIEHVSINAGSDKPIKIEVSMSAEVGLFQVEEVLMPKIGMSPAKHLVELHATVSGQEAKRYL